MPTMSSFDRSLNVMSSTLVNSPPKTRCSSCFSLSSVIPTPMPAVVLATCSVARSGLSLNKGDGVFHASEHAVLTATETLAPGGRQAPRIMFPFAQNLELYVSRQRRMRNNVLRLHEKGFGML